MGAILRMGKKMVFALLNRLYRGRNATVEVVGQGVTLTQVMQYDRIDGSTLRKRFDEYQDYVRYRTFELVAEEIRRRFGPEALSRLCVAEAGVFKGDFAWIINAKLPECEMYLYDTFEGFDQGELKCEVENALTREEHLKRYVSIFGSPAETAEQRIEAVEHRMPHWDKCHVRKGFFPATAQGDTDKRWVFVSLDMDLYQPMKEGILYFWPRLAEGGYMFLHDYNHEDFDGVRRAVEEAEAELGRIRRAPISDQGGTVILCK